MAKWFETAYGTAFVRGGKDSDTLQERIDEKVEELRSNTIGFNLINISMDMLQPSPTSDIRFYALIVYSHTVTKSSNPDADGRK